jgi:hypothetical protein
MTDDSNAKCRRGRPFAKGQSGNPGGRSKVPEELKEAMRGLADKAVEVLREAMECDDPRVRVMAATAVLDRGYGKPAQIVNAKIEGVDIAEAHLQALENFIRSENKAEQAANLLTLAAGVTTTEH